jgi:hypothetical protein
VLAVKANGRVGSNKRCHSEERCDEESAFHAAYIESGFLSSLGMAIRAGLHGKFKLTRYPPDIRLTYATQLSNNEVVAALRLEGNPAGALHLARKLDRLLLGSCYIPRANGPQHLHVFLQHLHGAAGH